MPTLFFDKHDYKQGLPRGMQSKAGAIYAKAPIEGLSNMLPCQLLQPPHLRTALQHCGLHVHRVERLANVQQALLHDVLLPPPRPDRCLLPELPCPSHPGHKYGQHAPLPAETRAYDVPEPAEVFLQASRKHMPLRSTTQQGSRFMLMSTAADHHQTLDLDIHALIRSRCGMLNMFKKVYICQ
jgi:hypothetical protein